MQSDHIEWTVIDDENLSVVFTCLKLCQLVVFSDKLLVLYVCFLILSLGFFAIRDEYLRLFVVFWLHDCKVWSIHH